MAATVIDALLVTLGLDVSKFKAGQKEANQALQQTKETTVKNTKEIEAKAKLATEGFRSMRREILTLVGAFASVGAIKGFVEQVISSDAALGRLSETVGVSTEELSAWHDIAAKLGGSAGDIDSAFRHIKSTVENIKRGIVDPTVYNALGQLLGSEGLAAFESQATTIAEKMKLLQRAVAGSRDQGQAMSLMQQAGFSEGTVVVMREAGDQIDNLLAAQIRLNAITKQNTEAAKAMTAAWLDATKAMEAWGRALVYTATPALEGFLKKATSAIAYLSGSQAATSTLGGDIYDALHGTNDGSYKGRGTKDTPGFFEALFGWLPTTRSGRSRSPGLGAGARTQPSATSGGASSPYLLGGRYVNPAAQAEYDRQAASIIQEELGRETDPRKRLALAQELRDAQRGRTGASLFRVLDEAASAGRRRPASSQSVDVSIGSMTVNTQAADAPGIARDIGAAIRANYSLTTQASYGTE